MLPFVLPGFTPWLPVPRAVRLGPGRIEWTFGGQTEGIKVESGGVRQKNPPYAVDTGVRGAKMPPSNPLAHFVQLAEATDQEEFVAFAERFGVLGLHHLTSAETIHGGYQWDNDVWVPGLVSPLVDVDARAHEQWYWGPLAVWRAYAREAQMIQQAAFNLKREKLVDNRTWRKWHDLPGLAELNLAQYDSDAPHWVPSKEDRERARAAGKTPSSFFGGPSMWPLTNADKVNEQRGALALVVTRRWLNFASLRPALRWYVNDDPRISLVPTVQRTDALFSTLAFLLAMTICAGDRLIVCARCGNPYLYEGKTKPRENQPHYCPACSKARENERKLKSWNKNKDKWKANRSAATATVTATAEVNGHS